MYIFSATDYVSFTVLDNVISGIQFERRFLLDTGREVSLLVFR
jgi:hypothetical protein